MVNPTRHFPGLTSLASCNIVSTNHTTQSHHSAGKKRSPRLCRKGGDPLLNWGRIFSFTRFGCKDKPNGLRSAGGKRPEPRTLEEKSRMSYSSACMVNMPDIRRSRHKVTGLYWIKICKPLKHPVAPCRHNVTLIHCKHAVTRPDFSGSRL